MAQEDQVLEIEGDEQVQHAQPLDLSALKDEATERIEKMQAKGRQDTAQTFSQWTLDLLADQKQAASEAIRLEAANRLAAYEERGVSDTHKRHTLAGKITKGDFG